MRTDISIVSANQTAPNLVQVTLSNSGQTKLADFNEWDVILNYYDSDGRDHVEELLYTTGALNDNQWDLQGIYLDATQQIPEVFDPGILDPGDQMVIACQLNPPVGSNTTNQITIATPNGVTASQCFPGYQSDQ